MKRIAYFFAILFLLVSCGAATQTNSENNTHSGCTDSTHDHSEKPAGQESFVVNEDGTETVTHTHGEDSDHDHNHDHSNSKPHTH